MAKEENKKSVKTFIVYNNQKRIFSVLIENKKPIRFMPGANELRSDQWDEIKANKIVKFHFEEELLSFKAGRSPDDFEVQKDSPAANLEVDELLSDEFPLAAMSVKEAKKLAKETVRYATLAKWFEMETREEVRRVIQTQLEKVMPDKSVEKSELQSLNDL